MGVIDINFLNLKTKHRISDFEAAACCKTLQDGYFLGHIQFKSCEII
jgi:hypothetical protein